MADASLFEVDTAELRRTGNDVLRVADRVAGVGAAPVLPGPEAWSAGPLTSAGVRFDARYRYLLTALAAEVDRAGEQIKGAASAYDEADAMARDHLAGLPARP